ncbi:hypothetical protein ACH4SK_08460 [Streptomyces inhibens]|uniref:hypothetical protein n=1 Tax=Streptomyces inhibens TaxID=2293571 RepID=UPI0037B9C6AC
MRRRGLYLDDPEEVAAYKLTFDCLRSQAADTSASLQLPAEARQELPHDCSPTVPGRSAVARLVQEQPQRR